MKNNFNPPFSLFREYVKQLMDYGKKFIIIGNKGSINYKEIFKYFKENRIWAGVSINSGDREFRVPKDYVTHSPSLHFDNEGNKYINVPGVSWWTNVENDKRNTPIDLYKKYSNEYQKYDNFEGIEVPKVCDIPMDYDGIMGVPTTFIFKYCPTQFEIIGITNHPELLGIEFHNNCFAEVNGKRLYSRLLIRRIKQSV